MVGRFRRRCYLRICHVLAQDYKLARRNLRYVRSVCINLTRLFFLAFVRDQSCVRKEHLQVLDSRAFAVF